MKGVMTSDESFRTFVTALAFIASFKRLLFVSSFHSMSMMPAGMGEKPLFALYGKTAQMGCRWGQPGKGKG